MVKNFNLPWFVLRSVIYIFLKRSGIVSDGTDADWIDTIIVLEVYLDIEVLEIHAEVIVWTPGVIIINHLFCSSHFIPFFITHKILIWFTLQHQTSLEFLNRPNAFNQKATTRPVSSNPLLCVCPTQKQLQKAHGFKHLMNGRIIHVHRRYQWGRELCVRRGGPGRGFKGDVLAGRFLVELWHDTH